MATLLDQKKLKADLGKFPSTFDFDLTNLTKDQVTSIIKKLNDDRKNTEKLEAEDIQISNFLSYLYFLLEDHEHASQHIAESLLKDPDNIIANVNRAGILLERGRLFDVEKIISKLQKLEKRDDYDRRKCCAEADLAYAYSRSGPWYHQRAVDLYTRAVEAYPTEYAWQFGLGLTLFRQTHRFNSRADDRFNSKQNGKTIVRATQLLLAVAEKSEDFILRAQAYARLGRAAFDIKKNGYIDVPQEIKTIDSKTCFEKAVQICPEEPSVLETCGQFARYRGELDTSEELLRKSLQINPTCQGYHHLALTLKRIADRRRAYSRGYDRSQQKGQCTDSRQGGYGSANFNRWNSRQRDTRERCRKSDNVQEKRPSRDYKSDQLEKTKQRNLRQMIKSPLKVRVYPGNKLLIEAVELLDRAEALNPCYLFVQYEKGIIYRMLGQIEKAMDVFKQIVSKRKYLPNETLLTNVYEQLGLCLLELSKSEGISPDVKQKYKKDGQTHLSNAVQIQSEIVANDPQFKGTWNSYSTLKELLSDKSDGKPRQLAVLHMLMGDHGDSIDIYKQLLLKEKNKMDPQDCINMLECYKKEGQYDECIALLKLWECTAILPGLPPSLIVDVYIEGAFHAYTTDNVQLAHQHFRRAFKVYGLFDKVTDQTEADEEVDPKDVLILHSCADDSECKLPRNLGTVLENLTGLRITINTDNILRNALVLKTMFSIIQKMPCIIIMTHGSAEAYDNYFVNHAVEMSSTKAGPKILVVSDDKCNMPDIARTKPFILMPRPIEGAQIPVEHTEWIKEFISLLKPTVLS